MSQVRYNDLAVWEPLTEFKSANGVATDTDHTWTVPADEIWEITAGAMGISGGAQNVDRIIFQAGNPAGNRFLNVTECGVANVIPVVTVVGTVWLQPGWQARFYAFAVGAGMTYSVRSTLSGRIWRI